MFSLAMYKSIHNDPQADSLVLLDQDLIRSQAALYTAAE